MAMTEQHVQLEADNRIEPHTTVSAHWALAVGVAWAVGLQLIYALEPVARRPDALPSVVVTAVTIVFNAGLIAMAVGLVRRRRFGFTASAATALLLVGMVVACPVSGHHEMGLWWVGQATIAAALMGLSLAGWQRAGRVTA